MIITQTPLRISFLGGGTDYPEYFLKHGGAVLATAVDKSACFCMSRFYSRLFDYNIRIAYRQVECVRSIDELQHAPFRECLRWTGATSDVEINLAAELPAFTGLGSSSSFVVGLLKTIYTYQGKTVAPLDLAYDAIEIERGVLKESVGCQDQTMAAVGGMQVVEFRGMRDFVVHPLVLGPARLRELEAHLAVFFTGVKRRAEDLAARQVRRVKDNVLRLSGMRSLVDEGYRILSGPGSLSALGTLLHKSWVLKRELDQAISSDAIDEIYRTGLECGALGGKLLGAGGGGFLLFFVPPERKAALRQKLGHLEEVEFQLAAPGAHAVDLRRPPKAAWLPREKAA